MKKRRKKKLKIAIFCTAEFATPPSPKMKDIYAPLWLTHYLTEGLVKRGHDVTLFASSDSKTKAKLISNGLISLNQNKKFKPFYQQVTKIKRKNFLLKKAIRNKTILVYDVLLLSKLYQTALKRKFDIIYIGKIGHRALPFAALCPTPTVFTQHSPLNKFSILVLKEYKKRYPQLHFVALTKSHASPAPALFTTIINNGINLKQFKFNPKPKNYLLVTGRLDPEKGISEAIKIARIVKEKLLIVGRKIENNYWNKKIKPYLDNKTIKYEGFVPYYKIPKYYQNARALLFPVQWEEPFGLVMIEAMACGTPVVAFDRGSVREVIKDGKTGFIVKPFDKKKRTNLRGFVAAIKKIDKIKREDCRKWVEENFSLEKMVANYEKLFYKILKK
ncbi:glycosyltransferase family 4 protein [bacterium]|nr:glycosyltransferase family 4 protein [bacterium]